MRVSVFLKVRVSVCLKVSVCVCLKVSVCVFESACGFFLALKLLFPPITQSHVMTMSASFHKKIKRLQTYKNLCLFCPFLTFFVLVSV